MADQSLGIYVLEFTILDGNVNRLATIETDSINLDCFAREKPADRQRFEGSLAEPLPLAIDSDPVLVGQVVKRCH
jgi:hypothetical protein